MTKFTTMESQKEGSKKKTIFKKIVNDNSLIEDTTLKPENFKNVKFLYSDNSYGDVFLAWDNNENDRIIFFGIKGDEFEE